MMTRYISLIAIIFILNIPKKSIAQRPDSISPLPSSVFDWDLIKAIPTKTGERKQFFNSATSTLENLEVHVTTLKPGEMGHLPHKHPEEEMTIVKEGTIEVLVNGELKRAGTGSIVFQAANKLHSIKNVGTTNATYYSIKWRSYSPGNSKK